MFISGVQQFTMLDFPGLTAAIVFTLGCEFRCGYCHNPEFVLPEKVAKLKPACISEVAFWHFLENRRGLLDGVVVTGGEPTLMPDLQPFIEKIKNMGFKVKLDSNGNRPDVLKKLFSAGLLDYVAMDIKTSLENYQALSGKLVNPQRIAESIDVIVESGVDHEFRSTLIREVHTPEVLHKMNDLARGKRWYLQNFRPATTLDPAYQNYHPFTGDELQEIAAAFTRPERPVAVRS